MARVLAEGAEVNARIVYWGVEGAGKRTSLTKVSAKLRSDHRGELLETPTPMDPSVGYTVLPIELGEIAGMRTRIELVAVPGGPEHRATRKHLLDQVDGVVLVLDAQASRADENVVIVDELRKSLADYAVPLDELPLVVQYNKRDLSDAYAIDELHRRTGLGNASVFETVATEGTGVLQALSTISKKVIRSLRGESMGPHRQAAPAPAPTQKPASPPRPEPIAAPPEPEPLPVPEPEPAPFAAPGPESAASAEPEPAAFAEPEPMPQAAEPEIELAPRAAEFELAPRAAEPELAPRAAEFEPVPQDDPMDLAAPPEAEPQPSPSAAMEEAILAESEGMGADGDEESDAAQELFEQPWNHEGDVLDAPLGARISPELSIVSVGQATRADERSVRVPLVLGDADGETSTLVLTIRLDPLVDETL
jgi:signal recognition particle receptor subunit beta